LTKLTEKIENSIIYRKKYKNFFFPDDMFPGVFWEARFFINIFEFVTINIYPEAMKSKLINNHDAVK